MSPRLQRELVHPNRNANLGGLRFSPDGKRLIAGDYPGGVVVVWDVASGKQLTAIDTGRSHRGLEFFCLTPDWQTLFSPHETRKYERVEKDGKRLMRWTFDGSVRAWDLASGKMQRTYQHQPPCGIITMQLSPDRKKAGPLVFASAPMAGRWPPAATAECCCGT